MNSDSTLLLKSAWMCWVGFGMSGVKCVFWCPNWSTRQAGPGAIGTPVFCALAPAMPLADILQSHVVPVLEMSLPLGGWHAPQADVHFFAVYFADGILPLDMEGSELLTDTFEVLSSKEIKLLAMRSKPDKDLLMEDDDMALANAVMQEAQKKIISQVSAALAVHVLCLPLSVLSPRTRVLLSAGVST